MGHGDGDEDRDGHQPLVVLRDVEHPPDPRVDLLDRLRESEHRAGHHSTIIEHPVGHRQAHGAEGQGVQLLHQAHEVPALGVLRVEQVLAWDANPQRGPVDRLEDGRARDQVRLIGRQNAIVGRQIHGR